MNEAQKKHAGRDAPRFISIGCGFISWLEDAGVHDKNIKSAVVELELFGEFNDAGERTEIDTPEFGLCEAGVLLDSYQWAH